MHWEWGSDATTAICIGAFLMLSWVLAFFHWLGYRRWRRAAGTVVRMAEIPASSADDGPTFAPVVVFTTADGTTVQFTEPLSTNDSNGTGRQVAVIYPQGNPQHARIAGNVHVFQLAVGAIGAIFVLAGLFFFKP